MQYRSILHSVFFVVFLTGCQHTSHQNATIPASYDDLISIANDEKKPLPERYKSASQAEIIALQQQNLKLQIESLRMTGMLLIRMDSLDKAIPVCHRLISLAANENDRESEGVAFNNLALIKSERSEYDSAILFYEKADRLFHAAGDTLRDVQCKINMGITYKNIGAFEKAFSISVEAARIMKSMQANDELSITYTTLGNTLKDIRRYDEALTYHNEALAIREKLADSIGIAGSLNNIGNVYKNNKQFDKALPYYFRSMEIKKRTGSQRSRATTYDNIAETLVGLNNYESAALYAGQALALRDQNTDKDGWMTTAKQLAAIHLARNEINKALELALRIEQLANNPNYRKHQLDNALLLQELYTKLNKPQEALKYSRISSSLKDSLFSSDMSAAISGLQVRYRTEEQQQKIEQADKDNRVKTDQIKRQTYFIILLAIVLVLLLAVIYLLYISNRLRTKARKKTELLMFELSHRVKNNLQIITGILNLQINESEKSETVVALVAAKNRIQSIGILHKLLYQKEYTGEVDMDQFMNVIAQNVSHAFGSKTANLDYKIVFSGIQLKADEAVLLGIIINELLTNIYKYANPIDDTLSITIKMKYQHNQYNLLLTDNGMEWQPPVEEDKNKGLGLRLVYMLANQIHATVAFERAVSQNNCSITFEKTKS